MLEFWFFGLFQHKETPYVPYLSNSAVENIVENIVAGLIVLLLSIILTLLYRRFIKNKREVRELQKNKNKKYKSHFREENDKEKLIYTFKKYNEIEDTPPEKSLRKLSHRYKTNKNRNLDRDHR